jgi:hypothetical protein
MPHVVIFRAIPIGSYDKAQYPILDVRTLQDFALDDVVTASRLVEDHAAAYPVPLKVGLGGSILMTGRVSSDFASFTTFQTCFLELFSAVIWRGGLSRFAPGGMGGFTTLTAFTTFTSIHYVVTLVA